MSLDQIWQDKKANFDCYFSILAHAKSYECEMIILPEMTLTSYTLSMSAVAESEDRSLTLNWFQEASFTIGLASIFGACLCDPATEKPRNTLCMACLESEELIINSKIHLFGFAGADNVLATGNYIGTAQIGEMNIGAAICYDLHLPELSSTMANQ